MNKKLSLLLTLAFIPVMYFASTYASKFVLPAANSTKILPIESCDFGVTPCTALYENQELAISTEKNLTTQGPISIVIDAKTNNVITRFSNVQLILQGKTMYMGIVQSELKLIDDAWRGELYIPFCTTETMDWVLSVGFETHSGKQYQANIEFKIFHS